ncbi:enoyl-CoA hydratase [Gilvimarinus polysaccharolyticus]|uniref:enoyl-CoA hydratase n=1 Tax=Gilvimarinus polysaccharolyticus TaxID=863921 RepID=UPI00067371FF|nr:enoyl-CoA hydratase [Gilvimarinus polysaccharolyticus]
MSLPLQLCEQIHAECINSVLKIQINRPAQKNALSLAMYQSLADALGWAQTAAEVRVVRITGSGDSFTSGNDLADFLAAPELTEAHPARQFMRAVMGLQKPLVAEVNGAAVGIGTTLLLHCDLVYACEDAFFQLPFVKLGLCPEFGASALLADRVGVARARGMLMLGEPVTASAAYRFGLINEVYSDERLVGEVDWVCRELASRPPHALAVTKQLLRARDQLDLEAVIEAELVEFSQCLSGDECRAAVQKLMSANKTSGDKE